MLFEKKTQNNIMASLIASVDSDISTEEGTLIDHSFRGAAAEFEQAYMALGMVDKNGYAVSADREHLVLRARERGIEPLAASCAVWKAEFNLDVPVNARFSSKELTYVCKDKIEDRIFRVVCEQPGTIGNTKKGDLMPVEYISGFEYGKLTELMVPARDEEETEAFRARYLSIVSAAQAFGGNRAQYKEIMHGTEGVGACKLYRATRKEKRIKVYFLDSTYRTPGKTLVENVQEAIDPLGKQGDGEGKAPIFHVVDIYPCASETVNIEAKITVESGYTWEDMALAAQEKIDQYFLELAKGWENSEYITVRILRVNEAIADVDGVVDVQDTALNGSRENLSLDPNAVPVRGVITCRQ